MLTEMAKGKTIGEAKQITNKDVAAALEGLPKNKLHCSNLGADALQLAIKDYESRKSGVKLAEPKRKERHEHNHGEKCYCPYCDAEMEEGKSFCMACHTDIEDLTAGK
jgi:nitrogen fixation NifU-like protein